MIAYAAEAGEHTGGHSLLGEPEFWVAVAFIIFIALIARIGAHKKMTEALDHRSARIKAELDEARRLREEAAELLAACAEKRDEAEREAQARALVAWLDELGDPRDGTVVVGDFNAEPVEAAYGRMRAAGFRSAFGEANGREPEVTWPSGLQGPAIDTDGPAGCLDYIWVRGAIKVDSCRLVFDRPAVGDPGLYPSDHVGLSARLSVG